MVLGSKTEESSSTLNAAVWCQAGDQDDSEVAWAEETTQNKRQPSLLLVPVLVASKVVVGSEEASEAIAVAASGEASEVIEGEVGSEVAVVLATKEGVTTAVAEEVALEALQMLLAALEVEVGTVEVAEAQTDTMIEETAMVAIEVGTDEVEVGMEETRVVSLEVIASLSVDEIEDTTTETIETAIETTVEDETTTTVRESDIKSMTATMIPDSGEGTDIEYECFRRDVVVSMVGWWVFICPFRVLFPITASSNRTPREA